MSGCFFLKHGVLLLLLLPFNGESSILLAGCDARKAPISPPSSSLLIFRYFFHLFPAFAISCPHRSTIPSSFSPILYLPFSGLYSHLPAAWCTRKIKLPRLADHCNVFWGGEGHYCVIEPTVRVWCYF